MAIQGPTICRKVDCCVENTLGLTHILCFLLALKEGLVQTIRANSRVFFVDQIWWREGSFNGSFGCFIMPKEEGGLGIIDFASQRIILAAK